MGKRLRRALAITCAATCLAAATGIVFALSSPQRSSVAARAARVVASRPASVPAATAAAPVAPPDGPVVVPAARRDDPTKGADPTPTVQSDAPVAAASVASGDVHAADATAPSGFSGKAAVGAGPDLWAVLIGVQHYHGSTHDTYGGDEDTDLFHQLLTRAGWPEDHILTLLDDDATAANIRSSLSWLVSRSSANTFTLFHYSGHVCQADVGPCASGHHYLWGVDNQMVSNDEVGQALSGLQGRAWVDIAGCEAADFDKGISSPNRLVTASSQANEKSYENEGWHESVWSGLLVDQGMLQGHADTNADGRISIGEAFDWAAPQATEMTQHASHGPQHPYIAGGDPANWYLPGPPPPGQPPAPVGGGGAPPTTPPKACGGVNAILHRC